MKNSTRSWVSSGVRLIVIPCLMAGVLAITGCSDPANSVVKDPSATPNKRTAKIDTLKGVKPGTKKASPQPQP